MEKLNLEINILTRDIAGYSTLIISELIKGPHNGN